MRVLGTGHRSAGILPATICRQDGGAPVLPNLSDCSAPSSSFRLGLAPHLSLPLGRSAAIGAGQGWQTGGNLPCPMVIPTLIPARLLCYLMSWAENAKRGCRFQLPSLDD